MRGILWAGLAGALGASAATLYVSPAGTNNAAQKYPDWAGAATNIQSALNLAVSNETVWVTNATYALSTNISVTNAVLLRSSNNGQLDATNTILNGQGVTRCLYLANANAQVAGFMITNGNGVGNLSTNSGGGVYMTAGVVSNCLVTGNTADQIGGGIYATGAGAVITDCRIIGNMQANTGAIINIGGGGVALYGSAKLWRSDVFNNRSLVRQYYTGGGGVFVRQYGQIADCAIYSNEATVMGGGVMLSEFKALSVVRSNAIVGNRATDSTFAYTMGGGICASFPEIGSRIDACSVVSNDSAWYSGGIGFYYSTNQGCIVTNCVIVGNTSYRLGGGIGSSTPLGSAITNYFLDFQIKNSTIAGNRMTVDSTAFGRGGGIYWEYTGLEVDHCVVCDNQSYSYGGIYFNAWTTNKPWSVRNSLIAGNVATGGSATVGGLIMVGANGWIGSCTIVSNRSASSVGGVYLGAGSSMSNTICYSNSAPTNPDWSAGASVFMAYNCLSTNDAAQWPSNITNAPRFVNPLAGDYRLAADSPGVNRGSNQDWMTNSIDLDGRARIRYGTVDMGAYETIFRGSIFTIH